MPLATSSFAPEIRLVTIKDKNGEVIRDAEDKECYAKCHAFNGPKGEEYMRKRPTAGKKAAELNPDVSRKKGASDTALFIEEIYLVDPVSKEVIIEPGATHDEKTALLTPMYMTFLKAQLDEFMTDDANFS